MSRRLDVIDGLRGVAILAVMYHHLFAPWTPSGWHGVNVAGVTVSPFTFLSNGWQGVGLFFMLSGFVLMLPFAGGTRRMTGVRDAWSFYARRAWRLLPLYVVCVVVSLAMADALTAPMLKNALVFGFIFDENTFAPSWNWAMWTLAVEAWFSLAFPFLVRPVARMRPSLIVLSLLAASVALHAAAFSLDDAFGRNVAHNFPLVRLPEFVAGMLLARLFVEREIPARSFLAPVGALLIVASFLICDQAALRGLSWWSVQFPRPLFTGGVCLLTAHLLVHGNGLLARAASWRPLRGLGIACYSLYAWHVPLLLQMNPAAGPAQFAAFALSLALVTYWSYVVLERGAMRVGERMMRPAL